MSALEQSFLTYLKVFGDGLPEPEREYRFFPGRRWASDFAWPEFHLLVEIEGGTRNQGRHVRPKGYRDDCEKYNRATLLGYKVLRYTADMLSEAPDQVIAEVRAALAEMVS